MDPDIKIPAYDPDLIAEVGPMLSPLVDDEGFQTWRTQPQPGLADLLPLLDERGLVYEERSIPVPDGEMLISLVRPESASGDLAAMYMIHGGGMVAGNRFGSFPPDVLGWVSDHNLIVISPEYTLAPERRAPRAAIECFAGLAWVADHAADLGVDPARLLLAGGSGGGGLAASVALLARDEAGPGILAQMLLFPQLGDRHDTVSSRQFTAANGAIDPWPAETNQFAWNALLGEGHEVADVSIYASPARATDLSGLPPTFIDVGGNEVFRDADVAYASLLWEGGVNVELHVWPGAYHSFDFVVPGAPVSLAAKQARDNWLYRTLSVASR